MMSNKNRSLEEQLDPVPKMGKNCALCVHFKVCGIVPLYANTIEPAFPDAIKANDLAWICKMYKEVED